MQNRIVTPAAGGTYALHITPRRAEDGQIKFTMMMKPVVAWHTIVGHGGLHAVPITPTDPVSDHVAVVDDNGRIHIEGKTFICLLDVENHLRGRYE
jgi:hypothetical protein